MKVYVYPAARPHVHDVKECSEYRNSVPFSQDGIARYVEPCSPDDAWLFYCGQFHYDETRHTGFHLENFPYLQQFPERHVVDIEGDWDFQYLDQTFLGCIMTMNCHDKYLPNPNMFVRPPNSRLLMSLLHRYDQFAFTPDQLKFGFLGQVSHPIRLVVKDVIQRTSLPNTVIINDRWHGPSDPNSQPVRDYEAFMANHGLSLCSRGRGDGSIRVYESCFYNRVPVVIGNHGMLGDFHYDTSFLFQISHTVSEEEMTEFFHKVFNTPFDELQDRANRARKYFDDVIRPYFADPTGYFVEFLNKKDLLKPR